MNQTCAEIVERMRAIEAQRKERKTMKPITLTRNGEALRRLAADLLTEATHYNQEFWGKGLVTDTVLGEAHGYPAFEVAITCDTHACLAGTTVVGAGHKLVYFASSLEQRNLIGEERHTHECWDPQRGVLVIRDEAERILGMTSAETRLLFDSGWRPAEGMEAWEAIEKLASGARLRDVTDPDFIDSFDPCCDDRDCCDPNPFDFLDACVIEVA